MTVKSRRLAVSNGRWDIYLDHVIDGQGNEVPDFVVVQSPAAAPGDVAGVAVLPITGGRYVLMRSYRHALGATLWDLPHGFIDAGETAEQAALRELTEETGLTCAPENLISLGTFAPDAGTMRARAALFAATHCEGQLRKANDELGLESLHLIDSATIDQLVANGEIEDAGTLIAYYRYRAKNLRP
ncbi:MAG: NUDIX hydrolase [Pseudolabrys sp.]|nr:NUDIX hydrolase [Pseudolabrys sp.]